MNVHAYTGRNEKMASKIARNKATGLSDENIKK